VPTDKEDLMDWLSGVSNDAEIGIEIGGFGQLALLAQVPGDVRLIEIGDIPYPAEKPLLDESRENMMGRLRQLRAEGGEREKGVLIVTLEGVVSGAPDLFSMSVHEAFKFKDRIQAKEFMDEFFDVIRHALILAC
jgi:hypothetical protein